jgi:hypothetical protein
MATVEIVKAEKQVNNELEVTIDARTSVGGSISLCALKIRDRKSETRRARSNKPW